MNNIFAEGYKIRDQSAPHFLTFTIVGWIDVFSRQCYRDIILESFRYCQLKKGLKIGAYVIMTNHVHVIWTATNNNFSDVVRDFKTFTSKAIIKSVESDIESRKEWLLYMFEFFGKRTNCNEKYKFWKSGNHPEVIHCAEFFKTKLNYIHQNPVRAGIVREASDYLYSSASAYEGKKGLIDIDLIY